jgi:cell division transport system permease protein
MASVVNLLRNAVTNALVNTWRHRTMTLATVLIISLMMTTLGLFLVADNALAIMVRSMSEKVNLIIYLKDDALPSEVLALRQQLEQDPRITAVLYITKDQALERLRIQLQDNPDLLQTMLGNPLPASLEVRGEDPDYLLSLVDQLRLKPVVEDVDFHQDVVQRLITITTAVRIVSTTMIVGLAAVTLFVVGSTIRLTVHARRNEIEILRLMGASDNFIRGPFLLEGALFGLVGAVVSCVVVVVAYASLRDVLHSLLTFLAMPLDVGYLGRLILFLLLFGTFIGVLGSYLSVRRFLTL